jgi:hypothetical protein
MGDFNVEEFLTRELKDLNKKLDDNTIALSTDINQLKTCIHDKVDEVKTDVNNKFEKHTELHLSNAKSFISTRLFVFSMIVIIGCVGTIFTYTVGNKTDISAIKAKHEIELNVKVEDKNEKVEINEESLPHKDNN